MYTGWQERQLSNDEIQSLYEGTLSLPDFLVNEYLIIGDEDKDYFQWDGKHFNKCKFPQISTEFGGQLKPRNPQQFCAFNLLQNSAIPIKLITGTFGSGKTMACVMAAMQAVERGWIDRIIFVRNNIQVANTTELGSLPGDEVQKTLPYLMPFCDHCGGRDGLDMLIAQGKLEVIPLGFLRGRSIRNAIIYSMESENLTKEHLQLLMGRVDEGSSLWLDGDLKQRDRTIFEKSQGLETMVARLKGNALFGYVHLIKSERSAVAAMADLLD